MLFLIFHIPFSFKTVKDYLVKVKVFSRKKKKSNSLVMKNCFHRYCRPPENHHLRFFLSTRPFPEFEKFSFIDFRTLFLWIVYLSVLFAINMSGKAFPLSRILLTGENEFLSEKNYRDVTNMFSSLQRES